MNIQLHESVTRHVYALNRRLTGTVEWIHPAGRFFLVRFDLPGGEIRECYMM